MEYIVYGNIKKDNGMSYGVEEVIIAKNDRDALKQANEVAKGWHKAKLGYYADPLQTVFDEVAHKYGGVFVYNDKKASTEYL